VTDINSPPPGGATGFAGDRGARVPDDDYADETQRAWERERPGTPTASIGVITRIWGIAKILSDERRRTLARLGIDAATLDLLSTLRRAGAPYQLAAGEIAARARVSAGAISQRVARAERAGLVTRAKSGTDGRQSHVALTDAGHALIEQSVDDLLRYEESLLSALSDDQRDSLSALLRLLLADLARRG
jgi:DNA-binding MarR family transcriptional regulator